jgi:hypothetical protein
MATKKNDIKRKKSNIVVKPPYQGRFGGCEDLAVSHLLNPPYQEDFSFKSFSL